MPPPEQRRGADCFPPFNASASVVIDRNLTSRLETNTHEDMQALMYIVCVLLFYSLGIVVGIITYLKREKQEIEESKMFDEFVTIINERQPNNRLIKVQEVVQRLEQLQREKAPPTPLPESVEIYSSGKNNYTSVVAAPPLGLTSNAYAVYETLNNEHKTMDIVAPKQEVDNSRNEDGYVSDSDPFQNKRLSQVVAQILDSNTDIGDEDVFDDVDGDYCDDEDSICTAFINYKEEPKNKELFRTPCKDIDDWDRERTQTSESSSKENEWPEPPKMKELVNESTALLDTEECSSYSPTRTNSNKDDDDKSVSSDVQSAGFRWSVTSV